MSILALPVLALVATLSLFSVGAYAENSVEIISQSSFFDSEGRLNVVGTVRNNGETPVQVMMGLEVQDENESKVLQELTYGRVIWPLNDSPFKFIVESETAGRPFIKDVQQAEATYYGLIVMNYGSMAVGEEKSFMGTVKNTAPYDIHNVSVFASVRSDNTTQLDTVRSNVIPVLKAGEEQQFIATPDSAVRSKVYYFSCAGLDFDAPITTIKTSDGKFIPYIMNAVAQISNLRYENSTDSIAFGIRPYQPNGGPVALKIPQLSLNQTVVVILDGKPNDATVRGDGKTLYIDFFIPKGDHKVEIQGVRNVPEFPLAMFALGAVIAGLVVATRFKAAFKIS